jgi:hypothetical protein
MAILAMGENEEAPDAFRRIVAVLMTSRNGEVRKTIQNSLFFKLRPFIGPDFAAAVDETEECMIPLPCIGHATVEEARVAHDDQFRGGETCFQWLVNMTPRILVIHLTRVAIAPQGVVREPMPPCLERALSLKRFTRPIERSSWYELTGIMAHIRSLNQGHYVTFCLIRRKWRMLEDSSVEKVSMAAVFAENFPDPASIQTAHILVYTLTSTRTDSRNSHAEPRGIMHEGESGDSHVTHWQ